MQNLVGAEYSGGPHRWWAPYSKDIWECGAGRVDDAIVNKYVEVSGNASNDVKRELLAFAERLKRAPFDEHGPGLLAPEPWREAKSAGDEEIRTLCETCIKYILEFTLKLRPKLVVVTGQASQQAGLRPDLETAIQKEVPDTIVLWVDNGRYHIDG